jgi:DNA polymerase-3 subunit epsilon
MGYLESDIAIRDIDGLKDHLTAYPENDYMRGLVYQYAAKWPHKKLILYQQSNKYILCVICGSMTYPV